jgi:hypothetical protein
MNDSLFVFGFERFGDLFRDHQRLVDRNGSTHEALREVFSFDQLHHECPDTVRPFETVDVRDVPVVQRGEDFGFSLEPSETIEIVDKRFGQDLQRDIVIQLGIARSMHLAHAPFADRGSDFVRTEARARRQGQRSASDDTAIARAQPARRTINPRQAVG